VLPCRMRAWRFIALEPQQQQHAAGITRQACVTKRVEQKADSARALVCPAPSANKIMCALLPDRQLRGICFNIPSEVHHDIRFGEVCYAAGRGPAL